jgi:D-alanine-D-alanine ligase
VSRIRVAVVFGGRSGEHGVSCLSAAAILRALDRDRYEVVPVGILPDGRWVLAPDDASALEPRGGRLASVSEGTEVAVRSGGYRVVASALPHDLDVVFPVLHGPYGEDGTVQGLLELAGVPYVGAGVFASAAAMDKQHMKTLLRAAGLPVGDYAVLPLGTAPLPPQFPPPWFVKPARAGSSLGISRVEDPAGLDAAVELARRYDAKVLVEAAIPGREIEIGVLEEPGGSGARASRPAEILLQGHDFYDFEAKYQPEAGTGFRIPADLTAEQEDRLAQLAVAAFHALDVAGLARVDFFLRPDATFVVNELNTMPGFTPQSMFPRMWEASGVSYTELVDRLIALALERGADRLGPAGG